MRVLRWVPALAWMAAIFWSSSLSSGAFGVPDFVLSDKLIHSGVYGLLAALYLLALTPADPERRRLVALLAAALASLYGASDEIHQLWTPGRSSELADWIADTVGGAAMAAAWLLLFPWGRR